MLLRICSFCLMELILGTSLTTPFLLKFPTLICRPISSMLAPPPSSFLVYLSLFFTTSSKVKLHTLPLLGEKPSTHLNSPFVASCTTNITASKNSPLPPSSSSSSSSSSSLLKYAAYTSEPFKLLVRPLTGKFDTNRKWFLLRITSFPLSM